MQTKPPQKLTAIKGHDFMYSALSVVFVGEAHFPILDGFNAVVRDGDAVCISSKIFDHLLGPRKGLLGIDNPIVFVEAVDKVLGERDIFLTTKSLEHVHEFPPEHSAHHLDGKKEFPFAGREPPVPCFADPATGDDAMHMWVQPQLLPPCVQHTDHPGLRPKMFGVEAKLHHRLLGSLEQYVIELFRIRQAQSIQLFRQGEHHMEVRHGQQIFLSLQYPTLAVSALTLGAMPVATRVVGDALMSTTIAPVNMSTQCRGSTFNNCVQCPLMLLERMMLLYE